MPHSRQNAAIVQLKVIATQAAQRAQFLYVPIQGVVLLAIPRLVTPVRAANLLPFHPHNITKAIKEDVKAEMGIFSIPNWNARANAIRHTGDTQMCLGNLSYVLSNLGGVMAAEYSGASSALTLLPTAGALIGAPTPEMWTVFQLVPVAGILSMFLSLGATITPSNIRDFDALSSVAFGGILSDANRYEQDDFLEKNDNVMHMSDAERFALQVERRANDDSGGGKYALVWAGMVVQVMLITIILFATWYAQVGSIVTWWCKAWGWMWFWYFLVVITSIFDNYVAEPFKNNWKMRVSRAPNNINISDTVSRVDSGGRMSALEKIDRGINCKNRVTIAYDAPSTSSRTCFYVIISTGGVSSLRASLRIISKWTGVSVFAFGTALFASSTLMDISAAALVLTLVLSAAIIGRLAGMWIAKEMTKGAKPIIHAVVKDKDMAAAYFEEMLKIENILIELNGHLVMDRKVIHRRNKYFSWSYYFGLLNEPFDVVSLASKPLSRSSTGLAQSMSWPSSLGASQSQPLFGPPSLTRSVTETMPESFTEVPKAAIDTSYRHA